jgi:hypothetical protein
MQPLRIANNAVPPQPESSFGSRRRASDDDRHSLSRYNKETPEEEPETKAEGFFGKLWNKLAPWFAEEDDLDISSMKNPTNFYDDYYGRTDQASGLEDDED